MRIRTSFRSGICLMALSVLAACTTLPDTSDYTRASYTLKQSAQTAGTALRAEFQRAAASVEDDAAQRALVAQAKDFDEQWGKTVSALGGMADYAEAVEDLTASGNDGAKNARELADSIGGLGSAVGLTGSSLISLVGDTAVTLYTAIGNVRASRSLTSSLRAADPIIGAMNAETKQQVMVSQQLFTALISLQRSQLNEAFSDVRDTESALREAEIAAARNALGSANAEANKALMERLISARALLKDRLARYDSKLAELEQRQRTGNELFVATLAALGAWDDGHAKLVTALNNRKPVSFQSLNEASDDVRDLVDRWRDL